jgi:DNA-binding winged helix-turn-helix (wHTH) protein/Tol biopolymer transport system component
VSGRQTHAPETRHRQYRFGDFTLDLDGGFLRRGADEVTLRLKAFDALTYLVERHGRLVTKAELIEAIWPDAAVTDNSLAQCLLEIRRALGDDSQQVIRTVARRGYVFAAPVTTPALEFPRSSGEAPEGHTALPEFASQTAHKRGRWKAVGTAVVVLAIVVGGILLVSSMRLSRNDLTYTQLTDFTDSAVAPALSPDGRMVAFIRGDRWFGAPDQIYVKMLPNGEAIQLTHDPRQKYGVAFSADGSKIAYTAFGSGDGWNTFATSPLGGEPSLLLANAAGLTWLDQQHLLFSEIKSGMHMGIVTATVNRSEHHEVYFPQHERAMAHYSYASPDRRWALVIEMDHRPVWQPCRLVPLDGSSPGRQVGPRGYCTGAGWSPDGRWMYFTVAVDEKHRVWRQRFPDGEPEQMTFGPAEEDGVAVTQDGALVTSIGIEHRAIWIHDWGGDRPLSSEGTVVNRIGSASQPSFSRDAKRVHYLRESPGSARELWRADVESGRSEPVLPGIAMGEYDISPDGTEVVFSTQPAGKPSQLWVAPMDRSAPPRQISSDGENAPRFGPAGQVLFRFTDNTFNYVGRMNKDGSGRSKVVPYPISTFQSISPDRRWLIALTPVSDAGKSSASMAGPSAATMAVPTAGGSPRPICGIIACPCAWSPDGRFLYVSIELRSRTSPGRSIAIPIEPATGLPDLPEAGIQSAQEALAIPGSRVVEQSSIIPGLDPATYAYIKTTAQRNLFRIALP